jgi:hypothetical protein
MINTNKIDSFLERRSLFAANLGNPELYKFIDHFGIYAGVQTIGTKLFTYEMLLKTVGIPGDIFEFGCWKGANLMFLAKVNSLLEPYSSKRLFGFDNFSGLPSASEEDGLYAKEQQGKYVGDERTLREAISLFGYENKISLVVGDALLTIPVYDQENPSSLISFAYLDFDLYEPTKLALQFIDRNISVGGVIVFDEACTPEWPGETLAMKQFLGKSSNKYRMLSNAVSKQPTVALIREI